MRARRLQCLCVVAGLCSSAAINLKRACDSDGCKKMLAMVEIARSMGHMDEYEGIPGWTLARNMTGIGVWQNSSSKKCVLAFEGASWHKKSFSTRAKEAMETAFKSRYVPMCGFRVLQPFAERMKQSLTSDDWRNILFPYLISDSCSNGVTTTGSSLGGVSATTMAACANAGQLSSLMGTDVSEHNFSVQAVYSFATPRFTDAAMENKLDPQGCFPGVRVVVDTDFIPTVNRGGRGLFAKMKVLTLSASGKGIYELFDCSHPQATSWPPSKSFVSVIPKMNGKTHKLNESYIPLMRAMTPVPVDL